MVESKKNNIIRALNRRDLTPLVSFILSFGIIFLLYIMLGYAPFGTNSLATYDANIQYLDFFAYFKDVLNGSNDFFYTFSKTLGGSNVALFSYYLSSPLNLLVIFFDKSELHTFFNLMVAIKLSLAASTFSFFCKKRFNLYEGKKLSTNGIVILLSLGYALSQYSIAQSNNILWLDGVYLLPLIMAFVYELIVKNTMWKLALTVGFAIVSNWYSAGMDCLFAIVYFFFELVLNEVAEYRTLNIKVQVKRFFSKTFEFGIAMATGVLLSGAIFLPTASALSSVRGGFDLSLLTDLSFVGQMQNVVQNYVVGAISKLGSVSLYCGMFALIGCICCFLSSKISKRIKAVLIVFLSFIIVIFYWRPLTFVFSLFKSVGSYWYRYSYVGIAVILFLSAYYYFSKTPKNDYMLPLKAAGIFSALVLILDYAHSTQKSKYTYFTLLMIIIISALMTLVMYINSHPTFEYKKIKKGAQVLIFVLCISELAFSSRSLMNIYHTSDVQAYQEYVTQGQKQIDEIKEKDNSIYRISQTSTRINEKAFASTANLNESEAFNYYSISGYTSAADEITNLFMDRMGYRTNGIACLVNTSLIGADSLLGVKYVLSQQPLEGFEKADEFSKYNGKDVYKNPYCFPMAFTYNSPIEKIDENLNPFEYQNAVYSQLAGDEVNLYTKVDYKVSEKNTDAKSTVTYELRAPSEDFVLYGNLPAVREYSNVILNVNDIYENEYSSWVGPSVFYIPVYDNDEKTVKVVVNSETVYDQANDDAQFYALNLNELEKVSKLISKDAVEFTKFENGHVEINMTSDKAQRLYLSIPYDKGWKIEVNGKETEPELFADCMMTLPLEKGEYKIVLKYEVSGLKAGIAASSLGVIALAGLFICDNKNKKKKRGEK